MKDSPGDGAQPPSVTAPHWEFCVAAVFVTLGEFAVAAWLPPNGDSVVVGIAFLPGVAILASYDGLLAGMLGILLSLAPEAYFLSGRHWVQVPSDANLQVAICFAGVAVMLAVIGSVLRSIAQTST